MRSGVPFEERLNTADSSEGYGTVPFRGLLKKTCAIVSCCAIVASYT